MKPTVRPDPQPSASDKRPKGRRKCPRCGSHETSYSRRRWVGERALGMLLIRPYRCLDCDHRFMRLS